MKPNLWLKRFLSPAGLKLKPLWIMDKLPFLWPFSTIFVILSELNDVIDRMYALAPLLRLKDHLRLDSNSVCLYNLAGPPLNPQGLRSHWLPQDNQCDREQQMLLKSVSSHRE